MKIVKKRGTNKIKFVLNERTPENKLQAFLKSGVEKIKGFTKKKGKKLIGAIATYRWGAKEAHYTEDKKTKLSKSYHKSFDTEEEADKIWRMGDIKTLANNKRLKGENYSWKKVYDQKAKKWIVSAYRHLQRGESYFTAFNIPPNAPLTAKNIINTFGAEFEEKYEYYASLEHYDKPYKLRDITITFIYENI